MRTGLSGHLRIAVISTALAMVPHLTGPCLARHPALQFTILSCTSDVLLSLLDDLQVDAGITYLDNEGVSRVQAIPLYTERYRFVTAADSALGSRDSVAWAELSRVRLCLLTPDMQNRRIMDQLMRGAGVEPRATLESNSQVTLLAHVLTGQWATILSERITETLTLRLRRIRHHDRLLRLGDQLPGIQGDGRAGAPDQPAFRLAGTVLRGGRVVDPDHPGARRCGLAVREKARRHEG